jgi:RHS repeat-associated protein
MLSGATDEVCVYGRTLAPAELQGIHAAGAAGRIVIPSNQRPIAFAGFDRELSDTLAFSLAGFACDDGVPSGQPLQTVWTQLEGPSAAQISAPSALATPVEASALGRYVFRLAASDGELEATSVVAVELRSSTPPNQPPVVDAGEPLEITLPAVAVLSGSASDPDGGPLPLAVAWSRATGPGTVAFANPSSATTTAAFGAPGVYTLRLTAADGEATVHSYVAVVVHPHVANEAPVADAGDDFTVAQWAIIPLAGAASDDGLPAPLTVAWTCLSGPAPVVIASPGALDSLAQFTQLGQYVLQLRAFDGEKQSLDTVTVTVVDPSNEPPAVDAGGRLDAVLGVPVALRPVFGDDGLPNGTLTFGWRYEAGSGGCAWGRNADGSLSAAFSKVGDHALGLTVSDGEYSVTDTLVVTVTAPGRDGPAVALTAPLSGTVAPAGASLVLEAAASDPDGTVESVSFHADGVLLGSVAGPGPWRWTWQNIPEGSHVLHAEAVNEIAQKAVSAPVSVEVEPVAPGIRLAAPAEGSFHPVNQPVVLQAAISGGVAVGAVEFLVDGAVAATRAAPPYVATALSAVAGTVQLQARAALSDGGSLLSAPVAVTFVEPSVGPPVLELASPAHGSTVTAPVSVVGVVHGANLAAYNLELRHCPDDADDLESWRIIGTGTAPRGAPGAPASLGTLDPTLLRNGAYELRIVAADCFGAVHVLDGHSLVLAGNMKVGHFQLGFEDLNIPLAGIPVQILRSYDSRGGLGGDFGPGWDLGFRSVQVQTSAPVGGDWEDYVTHTAAGIPFYGIRPVRRHVVSVAVGDEIQQFEVYSPTEQGFFPLEAASVAFRPINGSTGSLTLRGEYLGNLFVTRQGDSATLLDIATFAALEPQDWVYTTVDGTRLDIRSVFGLRKLTDRNANSLTFTATGITHSSGESIAFTRDAEGRIAAISIPGGDSLRYGYDGHGYLSTFIDAAGAVTAFGYVPHPAAPGRRLLESITDPLGNRALAASYDGDGRLTGQRDALGNAVAFAHDIPNRRHTVTGRLGNATVHEYDLRGNIVRTVDPLGNETLRAYDALDNEVAVTDPLGNTTTSTYDAKRNKLTETDPLGNTTRTTYNESNQPLTLTDAKGNTTSFAYDANGNVTSMADALGGATSFGYDARGNLLSMRDATGNTATYAYDSRGRVISTVVTDATGGVCRATSSGYDNRGNQIAAIAVRTLYANDGAVIGTEAVTNRYEYDSENRVTRTIHPDGTTSETEYNPAGEELRTVDALGLATENKHDAKGNLIRTDHPDGTSTVWSYDAEDRQTSEIHYDADGHVFKASSTEYDALGRQVSIVQADSLDPEGRPVGPAAYTVYDPIGRTVISYDERGNATAYEYDPASGSIRNSARAIDALGNITSYEYDANGNKTAVIDAGGHVTEFTYDAQNRLVRVTHPDATTTETVYDPAGRRSAVIDELGRRTDYAYDSLGRLLEVVQPAPTSQQPRPATRYAYDEAGNRIAQTDALGRTTRYRYDCMGRRVARILPGGEIESNAYDAVGQLSARTDFNGYATTFAYDALGRLVEESADPAHPSLGLAHVAARNTHAFDASGRPVHSRVWNGEGGLLHEEALSYDLAGRLVQATTSYGSLAYAYDAAGNLTGVASGNADGVALAYAYDELNRLQFVVDHGAAGQPLEHHYTYTPVGSLASVAYANGVTHAYAYNGRNRLTGLHISDAHGSLLNAFDYQLNAAGHRTRIDEATGRTRLFQYDNLNRLASEQITGDPAGVNGTVSYAHDLVGNRIASASTLPGVASQSNSYSVNDRLDSDACDDNGNTVAAAGITTRDVYDAWNRLVRRVKPDGTVVDLGYDHAGNRVSKTVTTLVGATFTAYLVDANSLTGYAQVLEELRDDGAGALEVFRTYAAGNDLIGQRQLLSDGQGGEAWVTHYHLCDGQGSVWGLADESGALTDYYAYDAYGIHLYEAGAGTPNLLRYTGEQWDSDLGQYYLRARFYEPTRGRFWTMDSYEGSPADPISLHKYLYANANPVMYVDPSGMYGFSVGELSFVQALQSKMRVWFYTPMATQLPRVYMALARCVNAFNLQFTKTIELYNRSYYSSRLLIQEIIRSGTICRDPGGVVTAIRYVANGSLNGSPGFYELVIDLKTNTILHFLFKGL